MMAPRVPAPPALVCATQKGNPKMTESKLYHWYDSDRRCPNAYRVSFVISTGDIMFDGKPTEYTVTNVEESGYATVIHKPTGFNKEFDNLESVVKFFAESLSTYAPQENEPKMITLKDCYPEPRPEPVKVTPGAWLRNSKYPNSVYILVLTPKRNDRRTERTLALVDITTGKLVRDIIFPFHHCHPTEITKEMIIELLMINESYLDVWEIFSTNAEKRSALPL